MLTTHNLGFPRIGEQRTLKFALERYWREDIDTQSLLDCAKSLRQQHWSNQSALSWVPVGDFSLYDHVLDMSFLLGNIPERYQGLGGLDQYFACARGRPKTAASPGIAALPMTKWFNTNYHYIVPELNRSNTWQVNTAPLLSQIKEAQAAGHKAKPILVGPLTYLWLANSEEGLDPLTLLPSITEAYLEVFRALEVAGVEWLQLDEPILGLALPAVWQQAFPQVYQVLQKRALNVLVATYFSPLLENCRLLCQLPVAGIHADAVTGRQDIKSLLDWLPAHKVLSLGVIDGRNVWRTDLKAAYEWLKPIYDHLGDRLWLAPSCSLLHVPVSVKNETTLDREVAPWLAFAQEKLEELTTLATALSEGPDSVAQALSQNMEYLFARRTSNRVINPGVRKAVASVTAKPSNRQSPFETRKRLQSKALPLPIMPTTTIGSFPQTAHIRSLRARFKKGELPEGQYHQNLKAEIRQVITRQEALGLDVLVHGEPERNDMVEYFGEQLEGFALTQNAWVQSYGSRCVKPPILYGDVRRPKPMTVGWAKYAQSLSARPVKGMLTGPVTILNWSFVRDDETREAVCQQLAVAIRDEVKDLESAGIQIIQIDEAALREGLPLRKSEQAHYKAWAIEAFRIAASVVADQTQIHTHMCYSHFNDMIQDLINMDADVITIESSRADGKLLKVFEYMQYPNDIGPGVYDIHSPNIPSPLDIKTQLQKMLEVLDPDSLWVNPDCGLKTRTWDEVLPALEAMVAAAKQVREALTTNAASSLLSGRTSAGIDAY